jgi:hypothetical protein
VGGKIAEPSKADEPIEAPTLEDPFLDWALPMPNPFGNEDDQFQNAFNDKSTSTAFDPTWQDKRSLLKEKRNA